jgi:hypothetical protein
MHYELVGYAITPTELTATAKISVKGLDQTQQNLVELQFRRIIDTQGWTVTSAENADDFIMFSLRKDI